ncbi:MAG: hypothetical protein AAB463_02485 [Patescibacteria group bacterium]
MLEELPDLFTDFDEADRLVVDASSALEVVFSREGIDGAISLEGEDIGGHEFSTEMVRRSIHMLNGALRLSGRQLVLESVYSHSGHPICFVGISPSFEKLARMEAEGDSLEPSVFKFSLCPIKAGAA